MKILVPAKRVPDPDQKIRVQADGLNIDDANLPFLINPFDAVALEEALRIRENASQTVEVVAVQIGDEAHQNELRVALAMGADRAIQVPCDVTLDPWNVACILKQVVSREQPDLVLMGKQAVDDDANQAGQFLAALLDWPQATFASSVEFTDGAARVDRETDAGIETVQVKLPAVVTADLRLNEPRYASLPSIMRARKKPIEQYSLSDLGVTIEPRVHLMALEETSTARNCQLVGSVDELVEQFAIPRSFDERPTKLRILVVAQHDGQRVRSVSRSALTFAAEIAERTGGDIHWLLLGHELQAAAQDAARYAPTLTADCPALEHPVADRYAYVIANAVRRHGAELLVAATNTFAKDIVSRAGGLLGGAMASDVIGHELRDGQLLLQRPMYAGAVNATIRLAGEPQIVTIRPSAYTPRAASDKAFAISSIEVDEDALPGGTEFVGLQFKQTGRPDVTEASVVVSGGRAIKNSDDFERLVGGLADALGGATASSRPLVDAGISPNEFQVGQTGKTIAPELYIGLGISGAVQHMAGMKNSRTIVVINQDPEAPIFEMADLGLVGDVYDVVPQLIDKIKTL